MQIQIQEGINRGQLQDNTDHAPLRDLNCAGLLFMRHRLGRDLVAPRRYAPECKASLGVSLHLPTRPAPDRHQTDFGLGQGHPALFGNHGATDVSPWRLGSQQICKHTRHAEKADDKPE